MNNNTVEVTINTLEEMKGKDITVIDTKDKTDVFDTMIIVTGTSDRHAKAMADRLVMDIKANSLDVFGIERERSWILIDLYDVIVHIMLQETRDFYSLEKLWQIGIDQKQASEN